MIRIVFYQHGHKNYGFQATGHAGFDEYGKDVVCAAVTSAIQMAANGITECLKQSAEVDVEENLVSFQLPQSCSSACAISMLDALELHLTVLMQEYPKNLQITYLEV